MQNSKIEWTDHTFNPWWGCQRVSPGCEHCYAETLAHRYNYRVWGPAKTTSRRMMSENYWKQPLKWNKAAEVAGTRARVFCASMADVFEDHPDLFEPRQRLFDLISDTPNLDWLLLTKRPENVKRMLIDAGRGFQSLPSWVWIGTSVEDQKRADERIPHLLQIPARVRFLSCEPLLGPVDLSRWLWEDAGPEWAGKNPAPGIDWIIAGGESGPGARPMHPGWARSLRDQCQAAGVAFFFKQWGEWIARTQTDRPFDQPEWGCLDFAGTYLRQTTTWNGRQEDPQDEYEVSIMRVGKHASGRVLDGRTWDELPA